MRSLSGYLLALLIAVASPLAHAVRVTSIYEAEVPVATQSDEDKLQAEQDALAAVFIKISGNSHILDNNPNLKSTLQRADTLVEEYNYSEPDDAQKDMPYLFYARFDSDGVNRILRDAGSAVWGEERPLILVWIALQPQGQPADIVDGTTGDVLPTLKKTAKARGLPVIFPIMDVADLAQVSVNDIGAKSIGTLQQASKRYDSNAILIGRLEQGANDYTGHWILVLGADRFSWDVTGNTIQDVMAGIVDNVTDTLASRFGMVVSTTVESQLTVVVQGITDNASLIRLMKYLQHQAPVTTVQLLTVGATGVTFTFGLHGTKEAFVQALANGKNLVQILAPMLANGTLEYKLIP